MIDTARPWTMFAQRPMDGQMIEFLRLRDGDLQLGQYWAAFHDEKEYVNLRYYIDVPIDDIICWRPTNLELGNWPRCFLPGRLKEGLANA